MPESVLVLAYQALRRHPQLRDSDLLLRPVAPGQVQLHGLVGSYYQKQMAQACLAQIDGIEGIDNQISVWQPAHPSAPDLPPGQSVASGIPVNDSLCLRPVTDFAAGQY